MCAFVVARRARVRHRARELCAVVLPPDSARRDRVGAHARVRHQCHRPRHACRDLFLRLHAAAGAGRRARRHARTAPHSRGRLADRRRRARCSSALAPSWEIAAVGRTLVGVGVSVAFIAILKICALWFPANRFATVVGVTMFAGNLGAVDRRRAARLARRASVLARGLRRARRRCRLRSASPHGGACATGPRTSASRKCARWRRRQSIHWTHALRAVLRNRATWPGFFVNAGRRRQLSRVRRIVGGAVSRADVCDVARHGRPARERAAARRRGRLAGDRHRFRPAAEPSRADARSTRSSMRCRGCRWIAHVQWPLAATLAWFMLMGLLIPGFTLSWTIAKEANRPEHSGIATAIVNTGIFLGTGILQPLVGWGARSRPRHRPPRCMGTGDTDSRGRRRVRRADGVAGPRNHRHEPRAARGH